MRFPFAWSLCAPSTELDAGLPIKSWLFWVTVFHGTTTTGRVECFTQYRVAEPMKNRASAPLWWLQASITNSMILSSSWIGACAGDNFRRSIVHCRRHFTG